MRATVEFDPDTTKAIEDLRRERGAGLNEAVNELVRRGMLAKPSAHRFVPIRRDLGLKIDVSNVAGAVDLLEGPESR